MYCGSLKLGKGIHIILQTAKKLELNNDILFYIVGGSKIEIDFWKNAPFWEMSASHRKSMFSERKHT